jgi:glucose-6-phosphate-specific signal transduction histidine kinase
MKVFIAFLFFVVVAFLAWPYVAIYRLDQALERNDQALANEMIDVDAVRKQIKRKLNKNVESNIGTVSNSFIGWLQDGIERLGSDAIDEMVNYQWIVSQLRAHNQDSEQGGFVKHLDYAFFDSPSRLLLRIGQLDDHPVHAHLSLEGLSWRITAIYN